VQLGTLVEEVLGVTVPLQHGGGINVGGRLGGRAVRVKVIIGHVVVEFSG